MGRHSGRKHKMTRRKPIPRGYREQIMDIAAILDSARRDARELHDGSKDIYAKDKSLVVMDKIFEAKFKLIGMEMEEEE